MSKLLETTSPVNPGWQGQYPTPCACCGGDLLGEENTDGLCHVCRREIADGWTEFENQRSPAYAELSEVRRILRPVLAWLPLPCTCCWGNCDRCRLEAIVLPRQSEFERLKAANGERDLTDAEHARMAELTFGVDVTDCPF